jgi:uncharacterized protein (DUF433 family)
MNEPDNNGNATPSPEAGEGTPEAAMLDTVERLGSWRTGGRYTASNAHRLTGISRSTLARWMRGYPDDVKALKPDWKDMSGNVRVQSDRLSFLELIEVMIASNIRVASGGSYEKVRKHHSNLAAEWETLFPFAHKNMSGSAANLHSPVAEVLQQLDYEDDFASLWSPMGKGQVIVVDPRRGSGAPTVRGRRLRVEDIRDYFAAGESIEALSQDFDLKAIDVETVLRYAILIER